MTRQQALRLPDERLLRLAPLALPNWPTPADSSLAASPDVRLFLDRVADVQVQAVADICRALDGVPLRACNGSAMALRDAMPWSHALLDERQRRVWRRLAVFRGGYTLEAAQAVCADPADIDTRDAVAELDAWALLETLEALVEKSLLSTTVAEGGAARFTCLESRRADALERLHEAGEGPAAERRHLHFMCADWQRADLAPEGKTWCDALQAQAHNSPDATLRAGHDLAVAVLATFGNVYLPTPGLAAVEQATWSELLTDRGLRRHGAGNDRGSQLRNRGQNRTVFWPARVDGCGRSSRLSASIGR